MTNEQPPYTALANFWLTHLHRTDDEVRREFDALATADSPRPLADAMRKYAEGGASPFTDEAVAQMDFAAIAADRWTQDRQFSFVDRLQRERIGARGRA